MIPENFGFHVDIKKRARSVKLIIALFMKNNKVNNFNISMSRGTLIKGF